MSKEIQYMNNEQYEAVYMEYVYETKRFRFAEIFLDIRQLLEKNGYNVHEIIFHSIEHAGGDDAEIKFTTFSGRNMHMTIRRIESNSDYDQIVDSREVDFETSDLEDQVVLDIIKSEPSQNKFTKQLHVKKALKKPN